MSKNTYTLAILMTCYNRRDITLQCLDNIYKQQNLSYFKISIFLVDDGSTDGTYEAVTNRYPDVKLLKGDGSLYWTGGMRKAMDAAMQERHDFYLWLNDDTMLYDDAISDMFKNYEQVTKKEGKPAIITGNVWDPKRSKLAYGGYINESQWHPLRFTRMEPQGSPAKCDVINGNVVLVPSEVAKKIGNLHPELKHAKGDYEYALRAQKNGFSSWITSDYVGECPRNTIEGTWKDPSLSLIERYKKIFGKKGEPLYPRMIYYSEYGGFFWPVFFLGVYLRPVLYTFEYWWNRTNKE